MSFPNSNFERNFSTYVFAKSFCYFRELKIEFGQRDTYSAKKILNSVVCVEVIILVEKCFVYEGHIFRGYYYKHAVWKRLPCV